MRRRHPELRPDGTKRAEFMNLEEATFTLKGIPIVPIVRGTPE